MKAKNNQDTLIQVFDALDECARNDVLMFGEMKLKCQQLKIPAISPNDWIILPDPVKQFIVEVLERATRAGAAYMSLLGSWEIEKEKNSRLLRSG